jgi:hypothetical protein
MDPHCRVKFGGFAADNDNTTFPVRRACQADDLRHFHMAEVWPQIRSPGGLSLQAARRGCTRQFSATANKEAAAVLGQKDRFPAWKIEQYHVYPDERARYADPTNPDRPPKPPDDPAAFDLNPNPQKPGKAGIAYIEGDGYIKLLADWDAENRATPAVYEVEGAEDVWTGQPLATAGDRRRPATATAPNSEGVPSQARTGCRLGLVNSREFQARGRYLAALPVTSNGSPRGSVLPRGRHLPQYTGTKTSEGKHNRWRTNGSLGVSKLFSTGGLLVARFANQTFVELTGKNKHTVSTSTILFEAMQPLLRGGGRAVTLEPLTQVERNLLYEVRDFARFRKEFLVAIASGGGATSFNVPTTFTGGWRRCGSDGGARGDSRQRQHRHPEAAGARTVTRRCRRRCRRHRLPDRPPDAVDHR